MELKAGYKQTNVGIIPEDWALKDLGDISNIFIGGDLKEDNFSIYQDDVFKYPVYSNTADNGGLYGYYDIPEYEGDSVTVVGRGRLGTAFKRKGKYGAIGRLLVLFPNKCVDSGYLAEYINYRVRILEESTSIPQLTGISLSKYKVAFPPILEQVAISSVLSDVDALISALDRLIAKKRNIKQAAMQELLTRGVDEHGNLRSEQTHEFKDSHLVRIPVEWDVKPAFSLCLAVIDCRNRTPPSHKDGHPVIKTPNVQKGKFIYENLTFTDEKSYKIWTSRGKPRVGDVIITREAPFGEACLIPEDMSEACLGQRIMIYQTDPTSLDSKYLLFAIYSEMVQKRLLELAGGSTVGHIRVNDIRNLPIPHPVEIKEQEKIARSLCDIDTEIFKLEDCREKTRALKQGMMQELLTGRIRLV